MVNTNKIKKINGQFEESLFGQMNIIDGKSKILIAVSGGADSMLLSNIVYNYFLRKKFNIKNIYFVHCNHKSRNESEKEAKFLKKYFKNFNFEYFEYNLEKEKTENNMRKWRYKCFQEIIKKYNIDFLFLGHHLNDRVETTFLNMLNGCDLKGFVGMKKIDTNNLISCQIFRPFLDISKSEIYQYSKKYAIPYFEDITNKDVNYSLRNKIRINIVEKLEKYSKKTTNGKNKFLQSFLNIYNKFEEKKQLKLIKINQSKYWKSDFAYLLNYKKNELNMDLLVEILYFLHIANNLNKNFLEELLQFLTNSEDGYKFFNGTYFFVAHGRFYIIKSDKKEFWKQEIKKEMDIMDNEFEFDGQKIVVADKWIGGKVRYPRKGDKIHGKGLGEWCGNHKIPVFWRNRIIVLVKDGKLEVRDGNNRKSSHCEEGM